VQLQIKKITELIIAYMPFSHKVKV